MKLMVLYPVGVFWILSKQQNKALTLIPMYVMTIKVVDETVLTVLKTLEESGQIEIIDESSISEHADNNFTNITTEDIDLFNERRNKRIAGESKTYSWKEAKKIITNRKQNITSNASKSL